MNSQISLLQPLKLKMAWKTSFKRQSLLMRSSQVIALIGAFLILAACASSPPERPGGKDARRSAPPMSTGAMARPIAVVFATMDTNQDRVVSASELAVGIKTEWALADANNDEITSAVEIGEWAEISLGSRDTLPNHMSFDRNLSGSITQTEFAERFALEFEQLDTNADQRLTRSELFIVLPARGNATRDQGRKPPSEGRRGGGGGRGG